MNHQHPPLLIHRPTTTQILRQTTAVFFMRHHLLPFLFLSFVLLFIHSKMETFSHSLTSFVDYSPSIKSLFSPIPFPPKPKTYRRHQLTGDDDFFTGIDEINHRFFGNRLTTKPHLNATPIIPNSFNTQLGFSDAKLFFISFDINSSSVYDSTVSLSDRNSEIEHQHSTGLYAIKAFFVSYGLMLLVYVLSQSMIHGIIFVLVVNHILQSNNTFMNTYYNGVILGMNRVSELILLKWGLRISLVEILSVWLFGSRDEYSVFKIVVRLTFLPFLIEFPFVKGFEKEINVFLSWYFWLDILISHIFAVCVWVIMVDSTQTCTEVFREGFYMLSLMINTAINLKFLEVIFSGSAARFILSQIFGEFLTSFIQSLLMIYCMVAWMVYYFSVKSMDATSNGDPFGQTEFEDMLNND